MKTEISAGGIVVTKTDSQWYVLLMKDMNGAWTFPKGKTEKGEDKVSTARREIEEEVGVKDLTLHGELTPNQYWYNRNGLINKTVYFYVFLSKTRQRTYVQKEEGISEAKWVRVEEALSMVGYPKSNVPLLEEAIVLLNVKNQISDRQIKNKIDKNF